jgi:hypothetical protein
MQAMYVTIGVAETITCFVNLTLYFIGPFLSLSTSRSSTSYNIFFVFADVFVNVHNSNYVKLITVLPDACDSGTFISVLSTKACKESERIYSPSLNVCAIWGSFFSLTPWPLSLKLLVEQEGRLARNPKFEYRDKENSSTSGPNNQSNP